MSTIQAIGIIVIAGLLLAVGLWYGKTLDVKEAVREQETERRNVAGLNTIEPSPTTDIPTVEEVLGPQIPEIRETVRATLVTSKGAIEVELDGEAAPKTVGNFVKLAQEGFYDGTTFHRVIEGFMIQGGDPLSKDPNVRARHGTGGPGYTFADEINDRPLVRGSLAMANAGPNTNGSQFFIVTAESTPWLNGRHTNFGEVVNGMDVVDAIIAVETDANDNPIEPVVVQRVMVAQ